jgi:hypothetical protein
MVPPSIFCKRIAGMFQEVLTKNCSSDECRLWDLGRELQ